jgi:protein-L-isoaspartate(D-aspartate) O-methyltransferase
MSQLLDKRAVMLKAHLAARGITDESVLDAFRTVPREAFVPGELRELAYDDKPLPIGDGQTISQPYIVALTVSALAIEPTDRVLEIGTGSGYAAAVLARVAEQVFTVERIAGLARTAEQRLHDAGFDNVHVLFADGSLGWPEHAPYDAIAVAAGGPRVPEALKQQLEIGGRLVMPVGKDEATQMLVRVTRTSETEYREEPLTAVRFVPLIGAQGFEEPGRRPTAEGA